MSFLEDFEKLRYSVPRLGIINVGQENAEYCSHSDRNKNCYLLFAGNFCEDCMYSSIIVKSRDSLECLNVEECELCYECTDCVRCYNCSFSQDLRGCHDCDFSYDCVSCSHCFGCVGLRQKEFYIFNKPVPKDQYKNLVAEWRAKGNAAIFAEFEKLQCTVPRLYSHQSKTENCLGDYIYNSKNCVDCFNVHNSEDCAYMLDVWNTKDTFTDDL